MSHPISRSSIRIPAANICFRVSAESFELSSFISYFFLDLRAVSSGSPISLSLHLRNKFESALRTLFVPGRYIVFETVSELILSKELEINYLKLGPTKSGFPNLGNTFSGQRSYTMEMRLFALKHVDSISPGV